MIREPTIYELLTPNHEFAKANYKSSIINYQSSITNPTFALN